MSKTNIINIIILFVISILFITIISFSYAHFNTRITNNEISTTIASGSGIMEITYSSGEIINVPNIFPDNNSFITKEFTITGNNSNATENMHYHLLLVLDENTFRSSALTYTLESNNIDDNGYTVPEIITQTGIKSGQREIFLGNGMFSPTNKENKVHSYTLKLYFPKIEHFEHGVDQGKTFKAHIETREGEVYPGYNPDKGVNHPVLFTGMTPVKWDENNDEINTTEDDPDWYDYDEKRWANAKSLDGSYWVWIPRYAYKIETCYHMSGEECENLTGKQAGDINVKFLKSTTNLTEDNTIIETTGYEAHVKDTSMHHFLHPAFQFNGEELGFWVPKFEPSIANINDECYTNENLANCNKTELILEVTPNKYTWRYTDLYNSFLISLNLKENKSFYGWDRNELASHLMRNHEWGAIAYLSISQYGADGEIWNNAYVDYMSGCSANFNKEDNLSTCIQYNTTNGVKASTTHNIYGIYDMCGGSFERTMGNYNKITGTSGFILEDLLGLEPKHLTSYFTPLENQLNGVSMDYDRYVYGDAIYETSSNPNKYNGSKWEGTFLGSWYNNRSNMAYNTSPWFVYGGGVGYADQVGIFNFGQSSGKSFYYTTFRPVLTPL